MAINYSVKTKKNILTDLGLHPDLVAELQKLGIKTYSVKTSIKFVHEGEVLSTAPCPIEMVEKFKAGTISSTQSLMLMASLKKAAMTAIQNFTVEGVSTTKLVVPDTPQTKTQFLSKGAAKPGGKPAYIVEPGAVEAGAVKALKIPEGFVTTPQVKAKLLEKTTLPLMDAHILYYPVQGTSPGSRYFLVASCGDLKIALRYKDNTMSFRCEGDLKKYNNQLTAVGFTGFAPGDSYCSLHLQVENTLLAGKTLGALLMGLGLEFTTPMPLISVIAGKGN